MDCSNFDEMPELSFQLAEGTSVQLSPDDYVERSAAKRATCIHVVHSLPYAQSHMEDLLQDLVPEFFKMNRVSGPQMYKGHMEPDENFQLCLRYIHVLQGWLASMHMEAKARWFRVVRNQPRACSGRAGRQHVYHHAFLGRCATNLN